MKALAIPSLILALLLALSLWNASLAASHTAACTAPLQQADLCARRESWTAAEDKLQRSYSSWLEIRPYFHMVMEHQNLDETEFLYAAAFAACDTRDAPDFHATLSQLQTSLEHLEEKQRFSLENIL